MPSLPKQRQGFVLVMSIAILAIAATAMARLANRSLAIVRQGTLAQRDLERRWEVITARMAFLQRGEELLDVVEQQQRIAGQGWPYASQIEIRYRLGGREYRVLLADEDAKSSLNSLYARRPEQLPGLLAQDAVHAGVAVRLLPALTASRSGRPFTGWGQVIDLARLKTDENPLQRIGPLTSKWTCWGSGKLRLLRASHEAIRATLADVLTATEIGDLIEQLAISDGDLESALQNTELPRRKVIKLKALVSDSSQAYSIRIQRAGQEQESALLVWDPSDRTSPETLVFEW